jgi:long-chain acyl-CoA synthetase
MAGYKIPRKLMITASLPLVHGCKLLRRELREQFSTLHG